MDRRRVRRNHFKLITRKIAMYIKLGIKFEII